MGTDRSPTVQNAGVRSTRTSRAPTGTQLCARLGSVQPGVSDTDRSPTVHNAGVRSTRTFWAPTGTQPSMTLGSVARRLGHRQDHNRRDVKGTDRNPAVQNAGLCSTRTPRTSTGTQPSTTLGSVHPGRVRQRPEPNRPKRWLPFNQDVSGIDRNPTVHDARVRSTRTSQEASGTQPCTTLGSVQPGVSAGTERNLGPRPKPRHPKRWGPFNQDVLGTDRNPTIQNAGVRSTRTSRAPTGTQPCTTLGSAQPGCVRQ